MELTDIKNDSRLLSGEAFAIYGQCMYKAEFQDYLREMSALIQNPACRIFACAEGERLNGIIVLELTAEDAAEIIGIAVLKADQRHGIGAFMVLCAARRLGLKTLTAQTDGDAAGFYEKTGFAVMPFTRHFPDGDVLRYRCRGELGAKCKRE